MIKQLTLWTVPRPLHITKPPIFLISNVDTTSTKIYSQNINYCGEASDCQHRCELSTAKSDVDISSLVQQFKDLAKVLDQRSLSAHPISRACLENVSKFGDEDIFHMVRVIDGLPDTKFHKNPAHKVLYDIALAVDTECGRRGSEHWDLPTMMELLDNTRVFARLAETKKKSRFLFLFSCRRWKKAFRLPLPMLLRYMKIVNHNRHWILEPTVRYQLEYALQQHIDHLEGDQFQIFFRAFNLHSIRISNDQLLEKIFERVVNDVAAFKKSTLREFLVFANSQIFVFGYQTFTPLVDRYLEYVTKNSNSMSLDCLCYSAILSTKFLLYRPELLERIYHRLLVEFSFDFVEAFEGAIRSFAFFDFRLPDVDVYGELEKHFRSDRVLDHFMEHRPKRLVHMVAYLSYVGRYSYQFVDLFLSPKFLKDTYKNVHHFSVPRDVLRLNEGVRIECPDYEGRKLDPLFRDQYMEFATKYVPRNMYLRPPRTLETSYKLYPSEEAAREFVLYERTMHDAASILSAMFGGPEYVHVCLVLPHLFGKNLIFCLDEDTNPRKLAPSIKERASLDFEEVRHCRLYVLVCRSQNKYANCEPMFVGEAIPKCRQLKRLGATLIEIVNEDWETMSSNEKRKILGEKIYANLNRPF